MNHAPDLASLGRPLRIVVTGGRSYADTDRVAWALGGLHDRYVIARLAHGGARGADTLAHQWAKRLGIAVQPYPVSPSEWKYVGPKAGPLRNGVMLTAEQPDLVVGFPGGDGTADCCRQAEGLRLRVWRVAP